MVYCKGYNLRTAKWEGPIRQDMGGSVCRVSISTGLATLSVPQCVYQPGSSLNPTVQLFRSLMVSFRRHDWLNNWPLLINSITGSGFLPVDQGVGLNIPTLLSGFCLSMYRHPLSSCLGPSMSTLLISMQETPYCSRESKSFRSYAPGTRDKDQTYILLHHNNTISPYRGCGDHIFQR